MTTDGYAAPDKRTMRHVPLSNIEKVARNRPDQGSFGSIYLVAEKPATFPLLKHKKGTRNPRRRSGQYAVKELTPKSPESISAKPDNWEGQGPASDYSNELTRPCGLLTKMREPTADYSIAGIAFEGLMREY